MTELPTSCSDVRAHVHLHVGGDLEAPVREAVQAHIENCSPCRDLLGSAGAARRALLVLRAAGGPRPELWPGVRERLVADGRISRDGRLRPASAPRPAGRLIPGPWVRVAASLAAAGVLGLGLWLSGVLSGDAPSAPGGGPDGVRLVHDGAGREAGAGPETLAAEAAVSPLVATPVSAPAGLRPVPWEDRLRKLAEEFPIKGERERLRVPTPTTRGERAASQKNYR